MPIFYPSLATPVTVPNGGTGLTTLTANNVILGNGSGTTLFVAPGSSGNVLTSNGTVWQSTAPSAGAFSGFSAYLSTNTTASGQLLTLDTTLYNTGSQYNTSTGIWTVPTTGKWLVTMCIGYASQSNAVAKFDTFGMFYGGANVFVVGQWVVPIVTSIGTGASGSAVLSLTASATYQFFDSGALTNWAGGNPTNNTSPVTFATATYEGT